MNKTLTLTISALVGGLAGALLVWLAVRAAAPTNIFIGFHSPASVEPDRPRVSTPRPKTFPQAPNLARSNESQLIVRSESISKNLPPSRSEVETPTRGLSHPNVLPEVINNSVVAVQNGSFHSPSVSTTAQPLLAGPALSQRGGSSVFDDALSFALEAADPYEKEGFVVREDFWGGELPVGRAHAIVHQLFKGNEYWFWLGTDTPHAQLSVHVYDRDGRLSDAEDWQRMMMASARVVPRQTGQYYVIVRIEKSSEALTRWAMTYGFR